MFFVGGMNGCLGLCELVVIGVGGLKKNFVVVVLCVIGC